ncbi:MAG: hypothetical protein IPP21_09915 [Betaproteobacteria bacterium]|nr:hypothetical protein [Betaproteobacteria bacterium]
MSTLYEYQPSARYAVEHAAGYAVFQHLWHQAAVAGGQQGKGMVVNNRTRRQTFMKMVGVRKARPRASAWRERGWSLFSRLSAMRLHQPGAGSFGASGSQAAAADGQAACSTGQPPRHRASSSTRSPYRLAARSTATGQFYKG